MEDVNEVARALETRYLFRSSVLNAAEWYLERIFRMDRIRARRDLRISVDGFRYLLSTLESEKVCTVIDGVLIGKY
ncbi:hypothetical protein JG688_00016791 [Phytophthora aleatoria]|uniref:Uncharacterized protein n=1 Tax=Phytophthora aleatoria TaxID=2496075 RepID=A0A8J5IDJ8_9STRA|nr:hypothetical protein JG688_00016791 [Phytophthora aleatoria]